MGSLSNFDDLRLPEDLREKLLAEGWAVMPTYEREVPSGRERTVDWWYRPGGDAMIQGAHVDRDGFLCFVLVGSSAHSLTRQAFEMIVGKAARGGLPLNNSDSIQPARAWRFYFDNNGKHPGEFHADR